MLELTAEKLRDFGLCRRLYHRKHIEKLAERKARSERDSLIAEFDDALSRTYKWFAFETMSGKVPSFKSLQWKWEKLWFKGITAEEIMTAPTNPGKNRNSYNTEAQKMLRNFYERNKHMGPVLMINERYTVPLTAEAKVSGTIDLVVREGNRIVIKEVGTRGMSSWNPGALGWYRMISDSIAFRHMTGGTENMVSIDLLRENRRVDLVITETDVNEIVALADEAVYESNWLPTRKNYFCDSCNFHVECYPNE